jgi:hypothetical protein
LCEKKLPDLCQFGEYFDFELCILTELILKQNCYTIY